MRNSVPPRRFVSAKAGTLHSAQSRAAAPAKAGMAARHWARLVVLARVAVLPESPAEKQGRLELVADETVRPKMLGAELGDGEQPEFGATKETSAAQLALNSPPNAELAAAAAPRAMLIIAAPELKL